MRGLLAALAIVMATPTVVSPTQAAGGQHRTAGAVTCAAREQAAGAPAVTWHAGPVDDVAALDEWCRGVGSPLIVPSPPEHVGDAPPPLDQVVVVSWNAHLAEGRLNDLVDSLRAGRLTGGRPVRHFAVLVQEMYRRGHDVPIIAAGMRSAIAIRARDPSAPDARGYIATLGLSMAYIPSMRNGADVREDRGNAILSTEPLSDLIALELPLERQRRVAAGATIRVSTPRGVSRLNLLNVHLEPLSSPGSLWLFRNPRRRQVAAVLDFLASPASAVKNHTAGTVWGGDFNTLQGGSDEDAYQLARAWSHSLVSEDLRSTHQLGRLDFLFFDLAPGWSATTERLDERFGSDHHPVLGRFSVHEPTP